MLKCLPCKHSRELVPREKTSARFMNVFLLEIPVWILNWNINFLPSQSKKRNKKSQIYHSFSGFFKKGTWVKSEIFPYPNVRKDQVLILKASRHTKEGNCHLLSGRLSSYYKNHCDADFGIFWWNWQRVGKPTQSIRTRGSNKTDSPYY